MVKTHFLLILILIFTVGLGVFYAGFQSGISTTSSSQYLLVSSSCDQQECLLNKSSEADTVVGFATLQGYFQEQEKSYFVGETDGEPVFENTTCPAFVVTGGSEQLIASFKTWVEEGNSVNDVNEDGNLLLTINTTALENGSKRKIETSNQNSQVEISVMRGMTEGRGAFTCESLVDILSVR